MKNQIIFAILLLILPVFSCTVDISGAPCSSDENCPKGQYCYNGKCQTGTSKDTSILDILTPDTSTKDATIDTEVFDADEISDIVSTTCKNDNDCISDNGKFLCIDNLCVPGECRINSDCKIAGYPTCENHLCVNKCSNENDCGDGYVCCDSQCKIGTCCTDKDCGENLRCLNNICTSICEKNEDCESKKCCDKSICADKDRGCCNNTECETSTFGFSCINYLCSCSSDYECPSDMICDKTKTPPVCISGCSDIHKCSEGYICCERNCIKGNCCTSKDCTQPGYPNCGVVNGERICVDLCDPSSQKLCNSPDNKYRCCKQMDNQYRCVIARCCTNEDCKQPDKPYCETTLETPDCINKCNIGSDIKCGDGYVCCYAFNDNMCFVGECCEDKDCNGKKCIGHHCVEEDCKSEPTICEANQKCCQAGQLEGICYTGECCYDGDCTNHSSGNKCLLPEYKCGCSTTSDCNSGSVCKNGVCISGDCITDSDCKDLAKPICINNKCSPCNKSTQCVNANKGNLCCNGFCEGGDCCGSTYPAYPNCEAKITKPLCKENLCSPCIDSLECKNASLGEKCCKSGGLAGDCFSGECCSSYDCKQLGNTTRPICNTTEYKCYPCVSDTECITEFGNSNLKCCSIKSSIIVGACYQGECCDDTQCKQYSNRPRCNVFNNTCVECLSNSDCGILGANYICCNNQCIRGECCSNKDCIEQNKGDICYQYHCRKHCTKQAECTISSVYTDCCTNKTTSPFPFCVYNQGGKCCTYDNDCDKFQKCCFGICIPELSVCF